MKVTPQIEEPYLHIAKAFFRARSRINVRDVYFIFWNQSAFYFSRHV